MNALARGLRSLRHGPTRAHGAAILILLLAGSSLLVAQLRYRGRFIPVDPENVPEPADGDKPAEVYFARLAYSDEWGPPDDDPRRAWMVDSPAAERHFLQGLRRLSNVDNRSKEVYVRATDETLFDYPWLYAVEPGQWDLSEDEATALRQYMLRGGFMVFDDFHGEWQWAMFMRSFQRIFPDRAVVDIDGRDEIFHVLYDTPIGEQIPGIQFLMTGRPYESGGVVPYWRGVYDDEGRLMAIINFNMDLGDAWEHADEPQYPERYTAMAYRFGINYIIYAMTH